MVPLKKSNMTSWLEARKQKEPYKKGTDFLKKHMPGFSKKSRKGKKVVHCGPDAEDKPPES